MDIKNKFFWFVGAATFITLLIFSVIAVLFWTQLSPDESEMLFRIFKQNVVYAFGGILLLIGIVVFCLDGIFHTYIIPISKLTEETLLINTVNPSHRIGLEGSEDIVKLANIINEGADRFEKLKQDVDEKISAATAETEIEKNILAAILAELPEGVLICNAGGQILLYNNRVKLFFGTGHPSDDSEDGTGRFIGLGRSIFSVIDRNCIVHALDEISEKLRDNQSNVVSYFVVAGKDKNLLRAETVPVLNQQRQFTGFILILNDITEQLQTDDRVGRVLKSLTTGIRASSAGIRSAVEAILEYPEMDREHMDRFVRIIHKESVNMAKVINKEDAVFSGWIRTQWPLVRTPAAILLESLAKRTDVKLGVTIQIDPFEADIWIRACSYSFNFAMLFVVGRISAETDCRRFKCGIERDGRFITITFRWRGEPIKIEALRKWSDQQLTFNDEKMPLTLKEVMGYHDAELWSRSDRDVSDRAYLGVVMPATKSKAPGTIRKVAILPESRPEFYDFDLFSQPGQVPELDNRLLSELTCTVFDTETTGLNPTGGDEIISIGAVRIVNGRLLREDVFDRLIDPKRDLPEESIKFHGIQPEMLQGQPTIETVLPLLQSFSEDTVLVAHNAAFDMRMLQVKEAVTGIKFINPVLDTLLLSAIVHPAQGDHNIEAIAERLGIRVVGRHTALGDALVTGEIFLKLIPLLFDKGIKTLKQARMASKNTYYARLKY